MKLRAWCVPFAAGLVLVLTGCAAAVGTNDRNTGGGGISPYEGHSARKQDASGTGSSATARGQGPIPGSGAPAEPGNVQSPSESNGGTGPVSGDARATILRYLQSEFPGDVLAEETPTGSLKVRIKRNGDTYGAEFAREFLEGHAAGDSRRFCASGIPPARCGGSKVWK